MEDHKMDRHELDDLKTYDYKTMLTYVAEKYDEFDAISTYEKNLLYGAWDHTKKGGEIIKEQVLDREGEITLQYVKDIYNRHIARDFEKAQDQLKFEEKYDGAR